MCANFEFGTSNTFRKSCDQSNKRLGKLCKDKTWWIVSLHQQHRGILERERLLWTNRYRLKLINVKVQGNWGEFHHLWYKAEQTRPSRPCEVLHWGQGQLSWENEIMDSWKLNVLEHSLLMYLKKKKTQKKNKTNKRPCIIIVFSVWRTDWGKVERGLTRENDFWKQQTPLEWKKETDHSAF